MYGGNDNSLRGVEEKRGCIKLTQIPFFLDSNRNNYPIPRFSLSIFFVSKIIFFPFVSEI